MVFKIVPSTLDVWKAGKLIIPYPTFKDGFFEILVIIANTKMPNKMETLNAIAIEAPTAILLINILFLLMSNYFSKVTLLYL